MYNTIEEAKILTSAWWALQELLITKIVEAMGRQQMTRVPTDEGLEMSIRSLTQRWAGEVNDEVKRIR